MAERTNEQVIHDYLRAFEERDAATLDDLRDPGWICDYPQSGERIRGHANEQAITEHYPGGLPEIDPSRIVGSEDRWVVTPSFTFERVAGSGDTWWAEGQARYPDESIWFVANLYRLREGRIVHEVTYWAEPFEPPAWRAAWIEPIAPD